MQKVTTSPNVLGSELSLRSSSSLTLDNGVKKVETEEQIYRGVNDSADVVEECQSKDMIRYFYHKNGRTIVTVAFTSDPETGTVKYGACHFSKGSTGYFVKKAQRQTANERLSSYPVEFTLVNTKNVENNIVMLGQPSSSFTLYDIRECIVKCIFKLGVRCRKPNTLATDADVFNKVVKYRTETYNADKYYNIFPKYKDGYQISKK